MCLTTLLLVSSLTLVPPLLRGEPPVLRRVSLPEAPRQAVRRGDLVYVAGGGAGLLVVDLARDRVVLSRRLAGAAESVALTGERAWVLTVEKADGRRRTRLHELTLKDVRVSRTIDLGTAGRELHVLDGRRLAIVGHPVRILDTVSGKVVARHEVPRGVGNGACVHRGRLYIPRSYAGGVVIIDPAAKPPVRAIDTKDWNASIVVTDARTWIVGEFKGLYRADLEKVELELIHGETVQIVGGGADLFAYGRGRLIRFQGGAKEGTRLPVPEELAGLPSVRLSSVGKGEALFLLADGIGRFRIPARRKAR